MVNAAEFTLDGEQLMAAPMDAMAITDGERHITVNQLYAEQYGYTHPAELAGEPWADRLAVDELAQFKAGILSTCREDGQWGGTVTGRRRDGSTFPQVLSIFRLDNGHFLCTVREAKMTESGDRERTGEQYATIIETVADGVYIFDKDLRFSFVNERLCEMVSVSQEDLIGTLATALFEYDDEMAAAEELRQRVVDGDTSIGTVQGTLPTAGGERVLEARYRLHTNAGGESS